MPPNPTHWILRTKWNKTVITPETNKSSVLWQIKFDPSDRQYSRFLNSYSKDFFPITRNDLLWKLSKYLLVKNPLVMTKLYICFFLGSFFFTWNSLWKSGTLFAPMYSTVAPPSDTTLVGVAKIMGTDSAGVPGLSPWAKKKQPTGHKDAQCYSTSLLR